MQCRPTLPTRVSHHLNNQHPRSPQKMPPPKRHRLHLQHAGKPVIQPGHEVPPIYRKNPAILQTTMNQPANWLHHLPRPESHSRLLSCQAYRQILLLRNLHPVNRPPKCPKLCHRLHPEGTHPRLVPAHAIRNLRLRDLEMHSLQRSHHTNPTHHPLHHHAELVARKGRAWTARQTQWRDVSVASIRGQVATHSTATAQASCQVYNRSPSPAKTTNILLLTRWNLSATS